MKNDQTSANDPIAVTPKQEQTRRLFIKGLPPCLVVPR